MFKTKKQMGGNEQVFNDLKAKFGDKYKVEFNQASSGAMKFVTGNTVDYISLKKNAYHGITIGVSPADAGVDYTTITSTAVIPNALVRQVLGRTGILDMLIAKLIFGSGNEFYDSVDNFIQSEYEATPVDTSLTNSVKQMFKGKSVLDD